MYLNTRPSFQAERKAAECSLNMKAEKLQYKWSEFITVKMRVVFSTIFRNKI